MANQATVTYIALLIPFVGMALGGFVIYFITGQARAEREMLHRERLAAIERGLDVPLFDIKEPQERTSPLRSALVMVALGVGLWVPVLHYGPGAWMWGFLLALVGLAQLAHWFLGGSRQWSAERRLDEEMRRAYIERLRSPVRPAVAEASKVD